MNKYRSYYSKEKNNDQERKEAKIRKIMRLEALENQRYSTTSNNEYKTAYIVLLGIIGIGCLGLLVYAAGRKSGRDTCKYKHY